MAERKPANVPFSLNDDDEDIFTSADLDRTPELRTPSSLDAIQSSEATFKPSTGPNKAVAHPVLTIQSGAFQQNFPLDKRAVTVGRDGANVPLSDPFVDRRHALLRLVDRHVVVEDLGSLNGIFLRIEDDLPLEDRDEIALGDQRFIFRTTWDAPPVHDGRMAIAAGASTPSAPRVIQKLEGGGTGYVFPIGDSLSIGHAPSNGAFIQDDSLAPIHATIVRNGEQFAIRNSNPAKGTFIRIHDPVELINGDCFLVGTTLISIQYP